LLIQNSDLSEYSLVNVRGMDAAEIIEALSAMNDDDRLSVSAYLESKGAWTTEIANEGTKEFGEYHLDVRYITDTNEIIDLRTEMEWSERAKEPIGADDVILKIAYSYGFEVERIANKTPEEVQKIMGRSQSWRLWTGKISMTVWKAMGLIISRSLSAEAEIPVYRSLMILKLTWIKKKW